MVGVAGKSKDCNSCRAKRSKCDLQHPSCKRCLENNRECRYERDRTFIVGTVEDRGRCSSHPHRLQSIRRRATSSQSPVENSATTNPIRSVRLPYPFDGLNDSNHCRMQFISTRSRYVFLDTIYATNTSTSTTTPLAQHLQTLTRTSETLNRSLLALCLVTLGTADNDRHLVRQSSLINSEALSNLRVALSSSSRPSRVDTMISSLCLFLYEIQHPLNYEIRIGRVQAWETLLEGTTTIIKDQGPDAFKSPPEHAIFSRFRGLMIQHAITRRQSTFLAESTWLTLPWEDIPKTPMDYLLDIATQFPDLLATARGLYRSPPSAELAAHLQKWVKDAVYIDDSLERWMAVLPQRCAMQTPLYSTTAARRSSSATSDTSTSLNESDRELEFVDVKVGLLYLHYWAIMLILYSVIRQTHENISHQLSSTTTSPLPSSIPRFEQRSRSAGDLPSKYRRPKSFSHFATSIAAGLPYVYENTTETTGPNCFQFPLVVALRWFDIEEPEGPDRARCSSLLEQLNERGYWRKETSWAEFCGKRKDDLNTDGVETSAEEHIFRLLIR